MTMDRLQIRVFVVITSIIITQQNPDDSTESMLFHYNGQTVAECPFDTFQIEFAPNCTETCPGFAPFLFHDVCLAFCPIGYEERISGLCAKKVQTTTPERLDTRVNLICQYDFCPKDTPFCFEYQCGSTCPVGTVSEDYSCVYTCSNVRPFIFNNTCVASCPREYPYIEDNHCVASCSTGHVLSETACIKTCPQGKYRTNTNCIDSCESENKYPLAIWNTSLCLDKCPSFTNINDSRCHIQCPRGLDFLWNMSCVQKCPDSMPFVYVLSKRLSLYKIPVCVPYCPDKTYIDGIVCVDRCKTEMNIFDRTCVEICPESHKYEYQQMCVSTCPTNFVMFNDTSCLRSCPINARYTYNMTCLETCPSGYKVLNDKCVDSCPHAYYLFQGKCLPPCSYSFLRVNDSCVRSCPEGAKYLFGKYCRSKCPTTHPYSARKRVYHYYSGTSVVNYCVKSCEERDKSSGTILYNMTCIDSCPSNLFTYNKTCVEKCPNVSRFDYARNCIATCPFKYHSFNGSCMLSCPKQAPYIFNRTCEDKCPSTHALQFVDKSIGRNGQYPIYCVDTCQNTALRSSKLEFNKTCVDNCPTFTTYFNGKCVAKCPVSHRFNHTAKAELPYRFQCVTSCKEYKLFTSDDQCVDHCTSFVYNSTCISRCPVSHKYINHEEAGGALLRHCVSQCPGNTYMLDDDCFNGCPKPFVSFFGNRSCLHRCPSTHQFRFLYHSNNKELFRCEKSCTKPRFIFGNQCVLKCPESKPYWIGQTCVNTCGVIHTFVDPRTKKCLINCTDPFVISNGTCVETCPSDSRFLVNNVCTKACPASMNLSSPLPRANICGSKCIDRFIHENNTCVSSCSNENVIVNKTCINSKYCPREYRYVEQSQQGKICRKTCLNSQFIQNFNCVTKCNSYFVNNVCMEKCPETHPFAAANLVDPKVIECHKKCPTSRFTEGFNCVHFCRSWLYIEDVNTCVKHCPASHPFKSEIISIACVKACTELGIIYNNSYCMLKSKCYESNELLIYNDQCVHECPQGTFLDMTKKNCISPTAATLIGAFILMAVSITLFVCLCFIIKCNSPSLKLNIIIDTDESLEEVNCEDNCASDINQEVYDTSSEQNIALTINDSDVSGHFTMEDSDILIVQLHSPMEPTASSSDQLVDIYAGEKHINENTQAKTIHSEAHFSADDVHSSLLVPVSSSLTPSISIPMVQLHSPMASTTSSSDQLGDIYAGEKHISETTQVKTIND